MRNWNDERKLSQQEREKNIIKYTRPKVRYEYSMISWNDYIGNKYDGYATVRSSIIPVTTINDETYWLLGSFHDYPGYICTDFGGNCVFKDRKEKNRQTPFGCAITEVHEESKGLLTQTMLKNIGMLDEDKFHIYVGKSNRPDEKVFFFFVPIDYEEAKAIIYIFNNSPNIDEKFGPLDLYKEKDIFEGKILTTHNLTDFVDNLTDR